MQLFQYLGLFEMKAQELRRDALRLQAAALCGVASTGFLDLMECFYRVEETEEEEVLGDTSSFAEFVSAARKEKARDKDCELISKAKVDVEDDEIDIDEEEDSDDESVASTASEKPKMLKQKKVKLSTKYPDKCSRDEAQLFFPTSQETMHDTGVPAKYIGSRENLPQYKGLYCCLFDSCDYGAQVRASTCSHLRRVHLGHAIGCRYCPAKGWWQARYWVNHMKSQHPDLPRFEVVVLPPNPEAVKIEPELPAQEEHSAIPVPKDQADSSVERPSAKRVKREATDLLSYEEWEAESREGELYLLADSPNPNQPRPKAAAIRYRTKPSGGVTAESASAVVTSMSSETPRSLSSVQESKAPTYSVASDSQAVSVMALHEGEEFESTETYVIES